MKTLPFIMNLAIYVLIVTSYFWVRNGVEILRGPRSIIKYKSFIYPWIHPLFMFYLYFDVLGSVSFMSVSLSYMYHWQWTDPFFVSMCIDSWSLWRVAPGLIVLIIGMFVCKTFPSSSFSVLSRVVSSSIVCSMFPNSMVLIKSGCYMFVLCTLNCMFCMLICKFCFLELVLCFLCILQSIK